MTYFLLAAGLAGLFLGGELLVRGAVGVARALGLSPLVIGLTVVGFGTSTPELLVSAEAALRGAPAIALGNVVGSNIANILLILGVSLAIAPMALGFAELRRDIWVMLGASAALWLMLLDGTLGRLDGALLVTALAVYLWQALRSGGSPDAAEAGPAAPQAPAWRSLPVALGGLALLMLSARAVIDSATEIARGLGISEAVIGLTIVAIGTSLPELATAVVAALRRQAEIAAGNVVGSNIFNILGILGLTAVIAPVAAELRFATAEMPVLMAAALALTIALWRLGRLPRWLGAGFLLPYAGYIGMLALQ